MAAQTLFKPDIGTTNSTAEIANRGTVDDWGGDWPQGLPSLTNVSISKLWSATLCLTKAAPWTSRTTSRRLKNVVRPLYQKKNLTRTGRIPRQTNSPLNVVCCVLRAIETRAFCLDLAFLVICQSWLWAVFEFLWKGKVSFCRESRMFVMEGFIASVKFTK